MDLQTPSSLLKLQFVKSLLSKISIDFFSLTESSLHPVASEDFQVFYIGAEMYTHDHSSSTQLRPFLQYKFSFPSFLSCWKFCPCKATRVPLFSKVVHDISRQSHLSLQDMLISVTYASVWSVCQIVFLQTELSHLSCPLCYKHIEGKDYIFIMLSRSSI